jgi:hypothetical protein
MRINHYTESNNVHSFLGACQLHGHIENAERTGIGGKSGKSLLLLDTTTSGVLKIYLIFINKHLGFTTLIIP